jgi:tungstate transport system substrate-binding protein
LIKELAQDYLKSRDKDGRIAWVCNHSRNTQLALLNGFIDFALTYERDQESVAETEGWSYTAGCVFHDHFCLAGPLSDPAGLASATSLADAFERIAVTGSLFHSRADLSATMWKERAIWSLTSRTPWNDKSSWYKTSVLSPSEALGAADTAGAYFLTDRSTVLRQTGLGNIINSTIFFEPTQPDDILMNSCYALFSPKVDNPQVQHFFMYLVSPRGQAVIREYGIAKTGLPLFAPIQDGLALTRLRGGRPADGRWVKGTEMGKAML